MDPLAYFLCHITSVLQGFSQGLNLGQFVVIYISRFPCGSAGKESACNVGDLDSIPGMGRAPGEGKGYPLQYLGLDNSMSHRVRYDRVTFTFFLSFFPAVSMLFLSHPLLNLPPHPTDSTS